MADALTASVADVSIGKDLLLVGSRYRPIDRPIRLMAGKHKRGTVLGFQTSSADPEKLDARQALAAASDGTQVPAAILAVDTDATAGPVDSVAYVAGEFHAQGVTLGTGITLAAARAAMHGRGVYLSDSYPKGAYPQGGYAQP